MRPALAIALLCGCTGSASPPTSFGVNVTVDGEALDDAMRKSIHDFQLNVTGDEPFQTSFDVEKPIQNGRVHFHYVPKIHSGTLSFHIHAVSSAGEAIAGGVSDPVTLVDGKAVDALVTLQSGFVEVDMLMPDGPVVTTCTNDSDCSSGHCSDGVCCDQACDGICESCKVSGHEGSCTAIPSGTDPDNECPTLPLPSPTPMDCPDLGGMDGGPEDGGCFGPIINPPDGGVPEDDIICKGSCNGARACSYPDSQTGCGGAFCNDTVVRYRAACDSLGHCGLASSNCQDYVCAVDACRTSCNSLGDCQPNDFCDGTQHCVPKKGLGIACTSPAECGSGFCESNGSGGAVCCDRQCDQNAGLTCAKDAASVGHCDCQGAMSCAAGCQIYYIDLDNDNHGNQSGSVGANTANADCAGFGDFCTASQSSGDHTHVTCTGTNTHWVAVSPAPQTNHLYEPDCKDDNNQVFPGQTAFFATAISGTSSFDYNCSNAEEKETAEGDRFCGVCNPPPPMVLGCTHTNSCSSAQAGQQTSLGCTLSRTLQCGGINSGLESGFIGTTPCGTTVQASDQKYVTSCGLCPAGGGIAPESFGAHTQRCH